MKVTLLTVFVWILAIGATWAQDSSPQIQTWRKVWEYTLPADTVATTLSDLNTEGGARLVTLHSDPSKEGALSVRIWRRVGEGWQTEWQTALDAGELRSLVAGRFAVDNRGSSQILTARNLVFHDGKQYRKHSRANEVNWLASATLQQGNEMPIAAFPGGLWRGEVRPDNGKEEWLRFQRIQGDDLLSLPQQFGDADWVNLLNAPTFRQLSDGVDTDWTRQGYERMFAQLGKRLHPDQPLLVTQRAEDNKQRLVLVVPATLSSPMRVLWQSEPQTGVVRDLRLISVRELRGGLLVLLGDSAACRVQFWQLHK